MSLEDFAHRLSETSLSIALTDSEWAFPTIESVHVIALTLVVGSIGVVDLRLLGIAARERDTKQLIASILPVTWIAFGFALITGSLLFVANPVSYAANGFFLAKLGLLGVAGLNMLLFHFFSSKQLDREGALAPRLSGAASLSLWIAIVAAGRWIGFTL
ncbi:hypothetical protein BH10PSE13_BH10PSE13_10390 [soil metagenome]